MAKTIAPGYPLDLDTSIAYSCRVVVDEAELDVDPMEELTAWPISGDTLAVLRKRRARIYP